MLIALLGKKHWSVLLMGMANMPFSPTAHMYTYLRYKAMLIALLWAPMLKGKEALVHLANGNGKHALLPHCAHVHIPEIQSHAHIPPLNPDAGRERSAGPSCWWE
jgi:hypothetical protein